MKRKCLAVGIILLFTRVGILPTNAQDTEKTSLPTSTGKNQLFDTTPVPLPTPKGWMKTFGEFGEDWGYSVQQTSDGGYIIAGHTHNIGIGGDVWLIKTDGNGKKVWDKIFGGVEDDDVYSVQQTSDNGYIIAGVTNYSGSGSGDVWLIKTNGNGNEVWNRSFGGTNWDEGYSVQQTADKGYIIAGMTFSFGAGWVDAWLIKTDENGIEQWNKTYGGEYIDIAKSVRQTADGGYIITGETESFGGVWLIKTDNNGKDIWCIRVTNEKNNEIKSSCLIDGCIHGEEWEGGEACLYLAEYLLINFNANKTITHILNSSEVNIVPLVNPDARQDDSRYNANGIDLCRNFDIDFGRIMGGVIPLGQLFHRIKIPYIDTSRLHKWFPSFPWRLHNCGRHPFSEPETQAMRDLMRELENNDFSFYVNCHTAMHSFGGPWIAYKPPFEIPKQEQYIYDYAIEWVIKNTEYENEKSNLWYAASGDVGDWCYKEFRIPSFGFEILSMDYDWGGKKEGQHDNLVHWMETTLPVYMYLLVNIDNLRQWRTPDIQPPLPEGVPPEPLK